MPRVSVCTSSININLAYLPVHFESLRHKSSSYRKKVGHPKQLLLHSMVYTLESSFFQHVFSAPSFRIHMENNTHTDKLILSLIIAITNNSVNTTFSVFRILYAGKNIYNFVYISSSEAPRYLILFSDIRAIGYNHRIESNT